MQKSDDPLRDFALWDDEQEEWLKKRPTCSVCGKKIQDDCYYEINHEFYCERCIEEYKRYFEGD